MYDKTFPPRPATAKVTFKNGNFNTNNISGVDHSDARQFNYYANLGADENQEEDVRKLEEEINHILKSGGAGDSNTGINVKINRHMSSKGRKAYIDDTNGEMDIYEDEESCNENIWDIDLNKKYN